MKEMPNWLGKTAPLRFDGVQPSPPGLGVQVGSESFAGSLTGDVTVEQVDQKAEPSSRTSSGMANFKAALLDH